MKCFVDNNVDNVIASLQSAEKGSAVLEILMFFVQKRHDLSRALKTSKRHLTTLFSNKFCAKEEKPQGEAGTSGKRKRDAYSSLRVSNSQQAGRPLSTPSQRPKTHST
jgi:hypothetical protein